MLNKTNFSAPTVIYMSVLHSHYIIGLFSENSVDQILHRAEKNPGYEYEFKNGEEPSMIKRFQTIRFKVRENAEQFIKDLQENPGKNDTLSEDVAFFLTELTVAKSETPISESRTLDYAIK